jgi:acyl-coenzyme A thioesterase PaaI-like protein
VEIVNIPFVNKVGVEQSPEGNLTLGFDESNQNHLRTIHASALFTLAESASGEALQRCFPELIGKVVPVVRDSQIKFKRPAEKSVTAYPSITDESISKFKHQYMKKSRSSIAVDVTLKDSDGNIVCLGTFNWFVQSSPYDSPT